jgi:hypothetical protein
MLTVYAPGLTVEVVDVEPPPPPPPPPPAPPPPAPPPPIPDAEFQQYLLEDSGVYGPNRAYWNQELQARWPVYAADPSKTGGNWLDAAGTPQGAVSYATLSIGPATPLGIVSADITTLAQKWIDSGHNRGVYLKASGSGHADLAGRLATGPVLVVTTSDGVFNLPGILAGWFTTSSRGSDTRSTFRLTAQSVGLLHFQTLGTVTGSLVSAVLQLSLTGRHSTYVITVKVLETAPPFMRVGGAGIAPALGLAAEVGEQNLPGHPDVVEAGDMRKSNLVTIDPVGGPMKSNRVSPAPLFLQGTIPTDIPGYDLSFPEDPAAPGTFQMRHSLVHGDGNIYATSGISFYGKPGALPDLNDPLRPLIPGTTAQELYARIYQQLDEDFWTTLDGIKGGIGFDLRFGHWESGNGGYWEGQFGGGNSGSPGTGLKRFEPAGLRGSSHKTDRWEYSGHSIRMHLGDCRPSGTPYERYRGLSVMASNIGPHDPVNPLYGSEETFRVGNVLLEKGRMHCLEIRVKMNTVGGPFVPITDSLGVVRDPVGNGVAVNDGIMQIWVDGVLAWEKTDFAWRRHLDLGIKGSWLMFMHGGTVPAAEGEVMHIRHNHYVCAKRYIGPHPGRV